MTIFSCRVAASLHDVLDLYEHLDEATTLFYAANVFLGLEHLHNVCDVAYRNVAPEAIMLGADGYALLMDLRFAREVDTNKLFDVCGLTPYLAPEQVSGQGHGQAVDYWALGILVYEMLTGETPFSDSTIKESEEAIYERIASHLTGELVYPDKFSFELVGVLDRLLEPLPSNRLCTSKAFRECEWIMESGMQWGQLESGAMRAPFADAMSARIDEARKAFQPSSCLTAAPFRGNEQWFDGFTSQLKEEIAQSFTQRPRRVRAPSEEWSPPLPGGTPEADPAAASARAKMKAKSLNHAASPQ